MSEQLDVRSAWIGFGMESLVLGVIGLLLFLLPVLGIPISALGLVIGFFGLAAAKLNGFSLRWSVAGVAVFFLALAVDVAIAYAPAGDSAARRGPRLWRLDPGRPYVPPPTPE